MIKRIVDNIHASILCLLILVTSIMIAVQPALAQPSPPPIAAPLVREGAFAVKLQTGLAMGMTDDEVEAENRLADAGISPRNGWIADYPVTPDIVGELQQAVSDAADSGKVSFSRDGALQRFNSVLSESSLSITPYSPSGYNESAPSGSENYPNPSVVNNYYYTEGPPVMTYYTPPPAFYYLYSWVPFPFWWPGFWFPGFFVLHDFHKTIIVDRRPCFVSNHFRDVRVNRVFRIDPAARFQGRTFGGIGASRTRGLLPTGVPGSDRRIFNNPPPRNAPGGVTVRPPTVRSRSVTSPPRSGMTVNQAPPRSGLATPSSRGGTPAAPSPRSGVASSLPRSGGAAPAPSHSGGGSAGGGHR